MDYPCAKSGDFSLSRFGFIVRTDRQTDTYTQNHRITHATKMTKRLILARLSSAWVISYVAIQKEITSQYRQDVQ